MRPTSSSSAPIHCVTAQGWARLRGLLGQPVPGPGTALRFPWCFAVHTVGMRYPIDLVFIGWHGRVCRVDVNVPPGRVRWCLGAKEVWEMAAGECARLSVRPGERLGDRRPGKPL